MSLESGPPKPKASHTIYVTSHNQSGGSTSATVNATDSNQNPKKSPKLERAYWAFSIVGVVAMIIIAMINMESKMTDEKTTLHVVSHNQSGGQTAGIINNNYAPQPRTLNDQMKKELLSAVRQNEPITIACVLGDSESRALAEEIKTFYLANNRKVTEGSVVMGIYTPAPVGLIHDTINGEPTILVGSRP